MAPGMRCTGIEEMCGKRQWCCKGSEKSGQCTAVTEFKDMEAHQKKCRFVIAFRCPVVNCTHVLTYHSKSILEHLATQHNIMPQPFREIMRIRIRKFEDEDAPRCFFLSSLYEHDGCFFLTTRMQSMDSVQFQQFYFTDDDDVKSVCVTRCFTKSVNEHTTAKTLVLCLSDLQSLAHDNTLFEGLRDNFVIQKGDTSHRCFKLGSNAVTRRIKFGVSITVQRGTESASNTLIEDL